MPKQTRSVSMDEDLWRYVDCAAEIDRCSRNEAVAFLLDFAVTQLAARYNDWKSLPPASRS